MAPAPGLAADFLGFLGALGLAFFSAFFSPLLFATAGAAEFVTAAAVGVGSVGHGVAPVP